MRWREQSSCVGWEIGLKLDWCIQPTADELSLHPRMQESGGTRPSSASSQMVIICAMYLRMLLVLGVRRWGGI